MKEEFDALSIPSFLYSTPSGIDDFSSCFRDIVCNCDPQFCRRQIHTSSTRGHELATGRSQVRYTLSFITGLGCPI